MSNPFAVRQLPAAVLAVILAARSTSYRTFSLPAGCLSEPASDLAGGRRQLSFVSGIKNRKSKIKQKVKSLNVLRMSYGSPVAKQK